MKIRANKQFTLDDVLFLSMSTSVISIFAFSNIRLLVIVLQAIFLGATILKILYKGNLRKNSYFIWYGAFLAWGLFTVLFAYNKSVALQDIGNTVLKLLYFSSLLYYLTDKNKINDLIKIIVLAGFILAIRTILLTPFSFYGTERLGTNFDLNPNSLGISLGYSVILLLWLIIKQVKKIYFIALLPLMTLILLTGSRKGFIMILIGFILFMVLKSRKLKSVVFTTIISIALFYFLYELSMNVDFLYNVIGRRIESLPFFGSGFDDSDASFNTRWAMIIDGYNLFLSRPLVGYGFENYRLVSVFSTYAHNNYIEVLVSTGIIGLFLYYGFLIKILIISIVNWLYRAKDSSLVITLLLIVLSLDFALVSYKHQITHTLIVLVIGVYQLEKSRGGKYAS